jgi:peroxiredoxin
MANFGRLTTLTAALTASLALGADTPAPVPAPLDPTRDAPGLRAGEKMPSVTLLDTLGHEVDLADYVDEGPLVITFYRGGWCPFCVRALSQWAEKIDALEEAGGTFIAISMETPDHASDTQEKTKSQYEVLVDSTGEAARRFRVAFVLDEKTKKQYEGYGLDLKQWNANGAWELPAPATFVVDKEGVIQWVYADWDYKKRVNPDEVIAAVRDLAQ